MKFGFFQFCIISLSFICLQAESTYSQSPLEKPISIELKNKKLSKILNKIERKTEVSFTYSSEIIDINQFATVVAKNEKLSEVLYNLLEPLNISYQFYNNIIVLNKTNNPNFQRGHKLIGLLLDDQDIGIQYANVILSNSENGKFIDGSTSKQNGFFELSDIPTGDYTLTISFLGFKNYVKEIEVNEDIDLGILKMEEETNMLEEVSISSSRKLIKQKIDRLIFDVEHSMKASKGDAFEVLSVTPGIRVNNETISMLGKSSVKIMVDDKIINLSDSDLANYLRSIPSEDIASIEVITIPPAKYEASGNSGLINIKLKKAKLNSWNALLRGGYAKRAESNNSAGASFNYNKDKLSIASSLYWREGIYVQEQDDYAHFPDGLWYTLSPLWSDYKGTSGRLDISYQITPRWSIGGQYLNNQSYLFVTDSPYTPVFDYDTNEIIKALNSQSISILDRNINSYNLNNIIELDTLGKRLLFNLDYFTYNNFEDKSYDGQSSITNSSALQYFEGVNYNNQNIQNASATIDLEIPTEFAQLELGGKVTRSEAKNDISFFNSGLVDDVIIDQKLEENDFIYIEDVQALYVSANRTINDKWSTKLGLRTEYTQTQSKSLLDNINEKTDYIKFFPTIYFSYKQNQNSTLTMSYSNRITRADFWMLNPNPYYVNPFQLIKGNPFLRPVFSDNFEFNHTYKNLSSRIYYSHEKDVFEQIPLPDAGTNLISFVMENLLNIRRFGISENITYDALPWWTNNSGFDFNYSIQEYIRSESVADINGYNARFYTSNDLVLNGSKTLSMNVSYWYSPPGVFFVFDKKEQSSFSLGLQYLLLDKKLKLSFNADDIFKAQADQLSSTINGIYQEARYFYDTRVFYFSASYSFGNNNIKAKKHSTGNQDERSRTGN